MALDNGIRELTYLSLLSKICSELETHLGFTDKVLAEFISESGRNSETVEIFDDKLKEYGADLPNYLVRTLFNVIHTILHPKPKLQSKKKSGRDRKTNYKAEFENDREISGSYCKSNPPMLKDRPVSRLGEVSGIRRISAEDDVVMSRRLLKRMSSPGKWELKQLIASEVLASNEYPRYDEEEEEGFASWAEGDEEELEIELSEDQPAFLQGQTRGSVDLSPVKVFKNPEGSLSRTAALQSALVKERRELREQQLRTMIDSIPKDLNRPWEDPMPEIGERHLAQELRGVGLSANFIEGLVMDAKQKGATFCQEYRREGNLIWPLLLDNVRPDMRIAWEEPFGPVLPVIRIGSVEEGIHHCNASNFGLQGCVFTKDINKAMLISDAMETGTVQINSAPARGPDHFPFQGFKDSGIGSQGVTNSINMMTKVKSTVINLPSPSYTMG